MRRMIIIAACILGLSGCDIKPQFQQIELSPECIQASADGGSFIVDVSGPADWVTDNTSDWISVRKENEAAKIIVEKNIQGARERVIQFTAGGKHAYLSIKQEQSGIFKVSHENVHFTYKGGHTTLTVECYNDWSISSCPDWISTDISSGNSPADVTLHVNPSHERDGRSSEIEFNCGDLSVTVYVSQDPSPYIAVETEEVIINGDGGNISMLYISNTDVEITTNEEWIRLIETAPQNKTVSFEVLRNLGIERQGYIMISSTLDKDYYQIITVKQGKKIDHPEIRFEEGTHMDIPDKSPFMLNPIFIDMKNTSLIWESDSPSIASVDNNGYVTVHTSGICTITAKNTFHDVSAKITLNIRIRATDMRIMIGTLGTDENPTVVRYKGEVLSINVEMTPSDAYTGDITCLSSDTDIARADMMNITCKAPGMATIYVESLYHGLIKSFTLIILED